jgi:CubicO group peptidase (beta-lactamase class C family)
MPDSLPRTVQLLHDGIAAGLHVGAQMVVSKNLSTISDIAVGESRPGVPLTSDTLMFWMSAGKPITAVAIAKLWERGKLSLDDTVAEHIPEFAAHGKDRITIRQCLTHTAGFRGPMNNFTAGTWDQIIARICAMRPEPHWPPGQKAGYHMATSWFILGEIIQRASGRNYSDYLRKEIFEPLKMPDAWIGMPSEQYQSYGPRLAAIPSTDNGERNFSIPANAPDATIIPRPGANLRCPARQFIKFYEMFLGSVTRVLRPQTIEAITAPHRVYMHDHTFNASLDWSLGFLINTVPYSPTTPYLYGPHASRRTFGHSGNQCSVAFADPAHGLIVCLAFNGMPGEAAHQNRMRRALATLYEELIGGLSTAGPPI